MKTTKQWLETIKKSDDLLIRWLKRQYIGEALAADRIKKLVSIAPEKHKEILTRISNDEFTHKEWITKLLTTRSIPLPKVSYDEDRYWKKVLGNLEKYDDFLAAGFHAETMRLERIKALARDTEIDNDIRETFAQIEKDEEFHANAFSDLASNEAKEKTLEYHKNGMNSLGLTI